MTSSHYAPNWISPPGQTIKDILADKAINIKLFAQSLDQDLNTVDELLIGKKPINNEIAEKLAITIGASKEFWLNRQYQYEEAIKFLNESPLNQPLISWVKSLPVAEMIKYKWIENFQSNIEKAFACLNFFNVDSVDEWNNKHQLLLAQSTFRQSSKFNQDYFATVTWLRKGELISNSIQTQQWSEKLFKEKLKEIRGLTREESPKKFLPLLIKSCADCGVALSIVKTVEGCRASGATRFLDPSKAMMILSFRYLTDDQFWFTFFHEAGHLLLHKDRVIVEGYEDEKLEQEANEFAENALIPRENLPELLLLGSDHKNIMRFARKIGISRGIIVGQLQKRGLISFQKFNDLKYRFNWEEISTIQ
jgi:HTH-type transcriptional regulator / antitoxin HigA